MSTKHTTEAGVTMTTADGTKLSPITKFEQDVHVHPETGKPISEVTGLETGFILFDGTTRRTAMLEPLMTNEGRLAGFKLVYDGDYITEFAIL